MCAATTTHSIGRDGYSKVHIVSQVPALNMYEALLVIHEAHRDRFQQISKFSRVSIGRKKHVLIIKNFSVFIYLSN